MGLIFDSITTYSVPRIVTRKLVSLGWVGLSVIMAIVQELRLQTVHI